MYVCLCSGVTASELEELLKTNPNMSMDELRDQGIGDNCCKCAFEIEEWIESNKINDQRQK